jgi:hypothetical protein
MFRLARQLARASLMTLALVALLAATFGVHGHPLHEDHVALTDHHEHDGHGNDGHGHDDVPPAGGNHGDDHSDFLFHAHGTALQAGEAALMPTILVAANEMAASHPELLIRAPIGLARDIDPPPNKRAL